MTTRRGPAIVTATLTAAVAVVISFVILGLCLAQPLEDMRPALAPLVNIGAVAILAAIAITTFRAVFRKMHGSRTPGAGEPANALDGSASRR